MRRHQMETFSALLALCVGIHRSPVNYPHKGQWRGALIFFYLRLNKRLSKQWWGWWFETPSFPLWRHSNDDQLLYSPCFQSHLQSVCAPDHGELLPPLDKCFCHIQTVQNYASRIPNIQLKMVTEKWLQLWHLIPINWFNRNKPHITYHSRKITN